MRDHAHRPPRYPHAQHKTALDHLRRLHHRSRGSTVLTFHSTQALTQCDMPTLVQLIDDATRTNVTSHPKAVLVPLPLAPLAPNVPKSDLALQCFQVS